MKIYCSLILLISLSISAFSQTIITGNIVDSSQTPVNRVSVTYGKINSNVISGFTQTDQNGYFKLPVNLPTDSIQLNLKHISYQERLLKLKNAADNYLFTLNKQINVLSSVVVSAPPIYKRNDTINYNIDSFTSKGDRVIADIIKKLPGIEMDGDKILYQGKPIQKYFINGLDLLENRYGIANNNLPIEAVKKVQIIENDQPIKILDSIIFSDRASLNIQLKKLTTTGTGKIGTGLNPVLWDVNLTPMTFSKNFQTINSLQTNNIGDNVSRQLNSLITGNTFDIIDQSDLTGNSMSFLNLQGISTPSFNEKKWLNNRIGMINSNLLQKLKNGYELKGSVSYVNDYDQRNGRLYTTLYTADQTIDFSETVDNAYSLNDLRGDFIILKNEKDLYLKNNFKISQKWNDDRGNLLRNDIDPIYQDRNLQNFSLSNRFTAVKSLKNRLYTLNSVVNLNRTPQNLSVTPGQFENIFADSLPYEQVNQDIQFRNFSTDNNISFVRPVKRFTLIPKIGILFQSQTLESQVSTKTNDNTKILDDEFTNHLQFNTTEAYTDVKTQYKNAKWRLDIIIPLRLRNYQMRDKVRHINNPLTILTFEPRGFAIYSFSDYLEIRASTGYGKQFGGINSLYNAYVLTSYRNLQRFNAYIQQSTGWNNNLSVNYRNTNKAIFSNLNYSSFIQNNKFLFKNTVDTSGFNTIEMVDQDNMRHTQSVSGDFSRFWVNIKTILKISGSLSFSNSDYLLNNKLELLTRNGYNASISINNNSLRYLNLSYETRIGLTKSELSGRRINNISFSNHLLGLDGLPNDNQIVTVKGEYYVTNLETQRDQIFIDLKYLFKLQKRNIDIELSCLNLLNNKTFIQLYNSEFSVIRNYFELRSRQFMLTSKFRF